jgi:iron(III) transport system substrate-binding protein
VVFSKDDRQLLDWVSRGQHPIGLAASETAALELKGKGVPLELVSADALREGGFVSGGFGSLAVLNRAPHPNAVKLYMDWLLSVPGQTDWSKASGYPSRRLDVPAEHTDPGARPKPGAQYQEQYKEVYVRLKDEAIAFVRSIIRD